MTICIFVATSNAYNTSFIFPYPASPTNAYVISSTFILASLQTSSNPVINNFVRLSNPI